MATLSLISLNVEKNCHNDRVKRFLREHMPDVACLQEVRPEDVEVFAKILGNEKPLYVPATHELTRGERLTFGTAIISALPVRNQRVQHYMGDPNNVRNSDQDDPSTFNFTNRMVLSGEVEKDGVPFTIKTTHFTWSARGEATDEQRESMQKLLGLLAEEKEFVLSGDFNAPRGGEIFALLANRYKDNIPAQYKTSIDASLHRNGKTHAHDLSTKMVDGLFSTPEYTVSNVELHMRVSDHAAITAIITKTSGEPQS